MSALWDILQRATQVEEFERRREATLPHVVLCEDLRTRTVTCCGPFPSRAQAERAALKERRADAIHGLSFEFTVVPVFPPVGRGRARPGADSPEHRDGAAS